MTHGPHHNVDNLRLEIEVEPDGLSNLLANPSGDLGAWAWVTPVTDTVLTAVTDAGTPAVQFTTTPSQAAHLTSEYLPLAAGQYVAASFALLAITAGHNVKVAFEWYDSTHTLLSTSVQTAALSGLQTHTAGPLVAPPSTAYVKARWDLYNGVAVPAAGAYFRFREATVAKADTSAELGSFRFNLVPNPSFETDLTGWATVQNCTITQTTEAGGHSGAAAMKVAAVADGLPVARTTLIPIVGGVTYTASAYAKAASTSRTVGVWLTWYDNFYEQLSVTSGALVTDDTATWARAIKTATAPSDAAYVTVELFVSTALAGEVHFFDAVMLSDGDDVGDYFDSTTPDAGGIVYDAATHAPQVTVARTNLVANPSFEVDTAGWTTGAGASAVDRVTNASYVGAAALRVQVAGSSKSAIAEQSGVGTAGIPVNPGTRYALNAMVRPSTALTAKNQAHVKVRFYDFLGATISTHLLGVRYNLPTLTWTQLTGTVTAPDSAMYCSLQLYVTAVGSTPGGGSNMAWWDAILFEQGDTVGDYFDGDTVDDTVDYGTVDRAWSGTAHASTSTETTTIALPYSTATGASELPYIEPVEYRNILGPTHEISITRTQLDVGLMGATIFDALLDPAVNAAIRPGRRVRLQACVDDAWQTVFQGKTTKAISDYPLNRSGELRTRVTLTASDVISHLANQGESRVVADIDDLPALLEGKGVPWDVNGSANQIPTASIVAYNENASILDAIVVARDTDLGYAWVSRDGVLKAHDQPPYPSDEIVPNGTFETDLAGWTTFSTAARSTAQARSGAASAALTGDGDYMPVLEGELLPVVAGEAYTITGYARAATTSRSVSISYGWYDADGVFINPPANQIAGGSVTDTTTGWSLLGATVTAPANAAYIKITLRALVEGAVGETHYFDDISVTGPAVPALDETVYREIDVAFDTEACINSVLVKWLRYDSGASTTEEVTYGPYTDAESIAEWGAHQAEFTITGVTEVEADIEAYADAILTANATPAVKPNSVTVPVIDDASFKLVASLDLYDAVRVTLADKVNDVYRVTSLEHTITPARWDTAVGFGSVESVAAPVWVPSPPFSITA